MPEPVIRRALISVSDKSGLAELGQFLAGRGVEILSTGGSAAALRGAGVSVTDVSDRTGFPEIMDGRVKTLQPEIHGGLLARRGDPGHEAAMKAHGIAPIDLLIVNLYPFAGTLARGADFETCVENIDVGGPAMIRAAAKNHAFVAVIISPEDYADLKAEMTAQNGATAAAFRRTMALRAFARTASYDAQISGWLGRETGETFPPHIAAGGGDRRLLRYGENPHQQAAFYRGGEARPGAASAEQVQGKELSFNNLNDADAAFELAAEFTGAPACVIVKHANPCGAALGSDLADAYAKAHLCDPESAFGGVAAFNRTLTGAAAEAAADIFLEAVIAPDADADARRVLGAKKNLRLLLTGAVPDAARPGVTVRSLAGGYLFQTRDARVTGEDLKTVTKRAPDARETADLLFAFTAAKHIKSNAVVYAKNLATTGVGAGQMSRVNAARIAAWKAEDAARRAGLPESLAKGSVAASDAFFPFADGLLAAAEAGATAVIQPGGSVRDDEVIAAADKAGLAMVFTGMRHFRH